MAQLVEDQPVRCIVAQGPELLTYGTNSVVLTPMYFHAWQRWKLDSSTSEKDISTLEVPLGPLNVIRRTAQIVFNFSSNFEFSSSAIPDVPEELWAFWHLPLAKILSNPTASESDTEFLWRINRISLGLWFSGTEFEKCMGTLILERLLFVLHGFMSDAVTTLQQAVNRHITHAGNLKWCRSVLATFQLIEADEFTFALTSIGKFVQSRLFVFEMVESHRPFLSSLNHLLEKDTILMASVPAGAAVVKPYRDHLLDMKTSALWHGNYWASLELTLDRLFNNERFAEQPQYICDLGSCGGALLLRIYTHVRDRTLRGNRFDKFPLTMIGADSASEARNETTRYLTKEGVPHMVVCGDIGHPGDLLQALRTTCGISNVNSVFHVRQFVDHLRPFIPPKEFAPILGEDDEGAFMTTGGKYLEPSVVSRSLEEHFHGWALALEGNAHGLFIIEVHSMPTEIARRLGTSSESLSFDILAALSGKLLVTPTTFLLCASAVGLFARESEVFPDPPTTRITAHRFVCARRARVSIGRAHPIDVPRLVVLEEQLNLGARICCESVEERLRRFPLLQFVVRVQGVVVASAFSQPVESFASLQGDLPLSRLPCLACHGGSCLLLLGAFSDPAHGMLEPAHELLSFVLKFACLAGYHCVAAVTRWSGFPTWKAENPRSASPVEDYFTASIDPTVRWHQQRGAKIVRLVPSFNPEDVNNEGNGVLIVYEFGQPAKLSVALGQEEKAPKRGANRVQRVPFVKFLQSTVADLLGTSSEKISVDLPVLHLGLDSLHLFELRNRLEQETGVKLANTIIFFQHPTIASLTRYFEPAIITELLRTSIASLLAVPPEEIVHTASFSEMGLRSSHLPALCKILEEVGGKTVRSNDIFVQNPTIASLAWFLTGGEKAAGRIESQLNASMGNLRSGERVSKKLVRQLSGKLESSLGVRVSLSDLPADCTVEDFKRVAKSSSRPTLSSDLPRLVPNGPVTGNLGSLLGASVAVGAVTDKQDWAKCFLTQADLIGVIPPGRTEIANLPFQGAFFPTASLWSLDTSFHGVSPREANLMDPQQRLLLKHTWWALEHSNTILPLPQRTGVFIGLWNSDFRLAGASALAHSDFHFGTGAAPSMAAGRIAYALNVQCSTMVIDTACSSGLVALHVALQSFVSQECTNAIVGAANVILETTLHGHFNDAGMLSPDSRCKTFDESANGYVRSEGCVAFFLGSDQCNPLARVAACCINQDGRGGGLTVPNRGAQEDLLVHTRRRARIKSDIAVMEAHGTGTRLGDPIEVHAIANASQSRSNLVLDAVKTSVGHTESAAGLIGLMRVLSVFQTKTVPKLLHFRCINAQIGRNVMEMMNGGGVIAAEDIVILDTVASLSSFGFSGTNANAIIIGPDSLEEPRLIARRSFVVSAVSIQALVQLCQAWANTIIYLGELPVAYRKVEKVSTVVQGVHREDLLLDLANPVFRGTGGVPSQVVVFCPMDGWKALPHLRGLVYAEFGMNKQLEPNLEPWHRRHMVTLRGAFSIGVCGVTALRSWGVSHRILGWGTGRKVESFFKNIPFSSRRVNALRNNLAQLGPEEPVIELGRTPLRIQRPGQVWLRPFGKRDLCARSLMSVHGFLETVNPSGHHTEGPLYPFSCQEYRIAETSRQLSGQAIPTSVHLESSGAGEDIVRTMLNSVAGLDASSIDMDIPFAELGFDSVLVLRGVNFLEKSLCSDLPATLFYMHPTAALLAKFISEKLFVKEESTAFVQTERSISGALPHAVVAISSLACRVAECRTANQLWDLVITGGDSVSAVPPTRWDSGIWTAQYPELGSAIKWGCFLSDALSFDHEFFKVSIREAASMDPQHKLLLETAWECLEDSNVIFTSARNVGVYVGIAACEFLPPPGLDHFKVGGSHEAIATGRVSYFFDLRGASMAINTACSASLVALHLCNQSVSSAFEEAGLAFGVQLLMSPWQHANLAQSKMLSPDGRCKTLDSSANGYVRAEGCGGFLLAPSSNQFDVCINGSAINQDGLSNGLTAPNASAQVILLRALMKKRPDMVLECLELHGTGTALGDPVEIEAVAGALAGSNSKAHLVRSVKTNIGHAETCAGALGVLVTALSLFHDVVPSHLHLRTLNPFIGNKVFEHNQLVVPQESVRSPSSGEARGISSFGFSGTNAHVWISRTQTRHSSFFQGQNFEVLGRTEEAVIVAKSNCISWLIEIGSSISEAPPSLISVRRFPLREVVAGPSNKSLLPPLHSEFQQVCKTRFGLNRPLYPFCQTQEVAQPQNTSSQTTVPHQVTTQHIPAQLQDGLPDFVRTSVATILGANPHDVLMDATFRDLGFDSLMGIELAQRLSTGEPLSATLVFEYATPNAVLDFLSGFNTEAVPASFPVLDTFTTVAIAAWHASFGNEDGPDHVWKVLVDGFDLVDLVPSSRFHWQDFYGSVGDAEETMVTKWGCFYSLMDCFDAKLFRVSPREAIVMDPQHRLLLQCSWRLLEEDTSQHKDVGVFVGILKGDYESRSHSGNPYFITGTQASTASGRISYFFDLHGTSISIDTACSSSLVAVDLALEWMKSNNSEGALCLGANALCGPATFIALSKAGMMSPSGRCKAFDQGADGYVRGEGCAGILLATTGLVDIIGHGVNQDGKSNGLTAPSGAAQSRLMRAVMRQTPKHINVREVHGSGTSLGDPIEVDAIARVVDSLSSEGAILSTCKGNIGHQEGVAGIAGLLKGILSLLNQTNPRQLQFSCLNPNIGEIRLSRMGATIPLENILLPPDAVASVSSFGMSGTNAFAVIQRRIELSSELQKLPFPDKYALLRRTQFVRTSFWSTLQPTSVARPLTMVPQDNPFGDYYCSTLSHAIFPELSHTANILHVGAIIEMLLSARPLFDFEGTSIDAQFVSAIQVPQAKEAAVHLSVDKTNYFDIQFRVDGGGWVKAVQGQLKSSSGLSVPLLRPPLCNNEDAIVLSGEEFYQRLTSVGLQLGDSVRLVQRAWYTPQIAVATLRISDWRRTHAPIPIACLDACAQIFILFARSDSFVMVKSLRNLKFMPAKRDYATQEALVFRVHVSRHNSKDVAGDVVVMSDADDTVLCEFSCEMHQLHSAALAPSGTSRKVELSVLTKEEALKAVRQTLLEVISKETQVGEDEIAACQNLSLIGVDSMALLVISSKLHQLTAWVFSTSDFLDASFAKLTERIFSVNWAGCDRTKLLPKVASTASRYYLYCFPFGGGDDSAYVGWEKLLPSEWEVFPVLLPGRASRRDEPAFINMETLVAALTEEIREHKKEALRVVFYGHSMGAMIATGVASSLKALYDDPVTLIVGACSSPSVPKNRILENWYSALGISRVASAVGFAAKRVLEPVAGVMPPCDDETLASLQHSLLADLQLVESFLEQRSSLVQRLPGKITVIGAELDEGVPLNDLMAWDALSENGIALSVLPTADHLFLLREAVTVVQIIVTSIV